MTLSAYEGLDVAQTTIRITKAGDGLSEGLAVEPVEFHPGERVFVILETVVTRVAHEPIKETDVVKRVHTLAANFGTIVDEAFAKAVLAEQRLVIEKAAGVERLPLEEDGGE